MKGISSKARRVINRSGLGRCDICNEQSILIEHHINGRDIVGAEKPWNKCNICPNDHAEIHYGRIIIEGWVMTTGGKSLAWHKIGEDGVTGMEAKPYLISRQKEVSTASQFGISTAD